jgi:hypothetical protein
MLRGVSACLAAGLCIGANAAFTWPALAQAPDRCELGLAAHLEEDGCSLLTTVSLGEFSEAPVFWHLYAFRNHAAAEAGATPGSTLLATFGEYWVSAIAEQGWRAAGGERVAVLGPLPVHSGTL